jgi:group I intron endonuclease
MFDTLEPNGYNIRTGGVAQSEHSIKSRERMRQSKLGPKNPNFGKSRTDETKQKISHAKSGEKHHFFGKTFSEEHKLALSRAHKSSDLPIYMVYVKPRPQQYQADGYAIVNHPSLKNKYFTSKSLTLEEKLAKASEYLQSYDMDAVQRLNVDGLLCASATA